MPSRRRPPPKLGRHEDDRGVIEDILGGPVHMVTRIDTNAGAIRGNHVHRRTVQWTYVLSGELLVATRKRDGDPVETAEFGPGDMVCDEKGVAHAWRALSYCQVLVFTRGPRAGENYAADTVRLDVPLLAEG